MEYALVNYAARWGAATVEHTLCFKLKQFVLNFLLYTRSDAHRVAEQKRRKDKDIELLAFNSEDMDEPEDVQVENIS